MRYIQASIFSAVYESVEMYLSDKICAGEV